MRGKSAERGKGFWCLGWEDISEISPELICSYKEKKDINWHHIRSATWSRKPDELIRARNLSHRVIDLNRPKSRALLQLLTASSAVPFYPLSSPWWSFRYVWFRYDWVLLANLLRSLRFRCGLTDLSLVATPSLATLYYVSSGKLSSRAATCFTFPFTTGKQELNF